MQHSCFSGPCLSSWEPSWQQSRGDQDSFKVQWKLFYPSFWLWTSMQLQLLTWQGCSSDLFRTCSPSPYPCSSWFTTHKWVTWGFSSLKVKVSGETTRSFASWYWSCSYLPWQLSLVIWWSSSSCHCRTKKAGILVRITSSAVQSWKTSRRTSTASNWSSSSSDDLIWHVPNRLKSESLHSQVLSLIKMLRLVSNQKA